MQNEPEQLSKELLERIAYHHNKVALAKAAACTFLSENREALGIPEPRYSETEYYLNLVARKFGLEEEQTNAQ